ncbi:acyl-CoA thioesterase [Geobacter hydrogenophilus]|uniref:Acyl-CoA thioesterase n=1 Tax=Geobacter hydrogenophilus TaxID=40983 RepID=A0A9W6G2J4_9BACT|nr:acyl-CoA thioesterase [Geobacter hydrogenophilus]
MRGVRHHETQIKVRFNEIDAYRVAWHGHYVAWMEVGRSALAEQFGLDVESLAAAGFLGPVVTLELKYLQPALLGEILTVRTSLARGEAATLEFRCTVIDSDGKARARGKTVHVLTDLDGVLQYQLPQVIGERVERMLVWQEGP